MVCLDSSFAILVRVSGRHGFRARPRGCLAPGRPALGNDWPGLAGLIWNIKITVMPIHLPPISRRRFLAGSAAAAAGGLWARWSWAEPLKADPHFFALISDTHVAADLKETSRGVTMAENFRRVCDEI